MTEADLPAVEAWLRLPHVARWWTPDTTAEAEIAKYRERVRQDSRPATHMLMVTLDSVPVGWCQWYRWADYPADAEAIGARDGEIGIDYAIGDPAQVGRGVGTTLIATLTTEIRRPHTGAGILADISANGDVDVNFTPSAPLKGPAGTYKFSGTEVGTYSSTKTSATSGTFSGTYSHTDLTISVNGGAPTTATPNIGPGSYQCTGKVLSLRFPPGGNEVTYTLSPTK